MATFVVRKNGKIQAKIRKNGRVFSAIFSSRQDAEIWARKTESEIERGIYLDDLIEAKKTTFAQAMAQFEEEHLSTLSDPGRQKNRARLILERCGWGQKPLAGVSGKDVAQFARSLEKLGLGANTIRLDLALISRLFTYAKKQWGMESLKNPADAVQRPSLKGTARTRRLEDGEEKRLLDAAHADFVPVISFALETAMRREEIADLAWKNIDLQKKRTAHLPKTKNGEARTVPLSTRAVEILQALPRRVDGGPVFSLSKDQITDRMRTTVKRAGLKDLRFHDLRHEATSRLFERGALEMMEVAAITGHKTLSMLRRYTHLRAEDLAKKLG